MSPSQNSALASPKNTSATSATSRAAVKAPRAPRQSPAAMASNPALTRVPAAAGPTPGSSLTPASSQIAKRRTRADLPRSPSIARAESKHFHPLIADLPSSPVDDHEEMALAQLWR